VAETAGLRDRQLPGHRRCSRRYCWHGLAREKIQTLDTAGSPKASLDQADANPMRPGDARLEGRMGEARPELDVRLTGTNHRAWMRTTAFLMLPAFNAP